MPARPVQISLDEELLKRIDEDPEAREKGRSAFIRLAVASYLSVKERREIADRLVRAYSGQADALLEEVEDLLEGQTWPNG
jgi:metal-responsive CopG/Arc/MetJ family transcriptional regulator